MGVVVVALLVLLLAASRLVKHPFNFTPVAAMAIFAGCYFKKYWGVILPVGAMIVSDYFIGFYDWQVMVSVYFSIALAYLVGYFVAGHKKWYTVLGGAFVSSLIFFVITNFAVWAFFNWYPHTWAGLVSDFTMALPFYRNTLLGDLFYTVILFGAYEGVLYIIKAREAKKAESV